MVVKYYDSITSNCGCYHVVIAYNYKLYVWGIVQIQWGNEPYLCRGYSGKPMISRGNKGQYCIRKEWKWYCGNQILESWLHFLSAEDWLEGAIQTISRSTPLKLPRKNDLEVSVAKKTKTFFLPTKVSQPVRPTHCTQLLLHRPSRTSCEVTWWPMVNPRHDK